MQQGEAAEPLGRGERRSGPVGGVAEPIHGTCQDEFQVVELR